MTQIADSSPRAMLFVSSVKGYSGVNGLDRLKEVLGGPSDCDVRVMTANELLDDGGWGFFKLQNSLSFHSHIGVSHRFPKGSIVRIWDMESVMSPSVL